MESRKIGLSYLLISGSCFLFAGCLGLWIRFAHWSLLTPGLDLSLYDRICSAHGALMILLFVGPTTHAALGYLVLPKFLKRPTLEPRLLNLLGIVCFACGVPFFLYGLLSGNLQTGWIQTSSLFTQSQTPTAAFSLAGVALIYIAIFFSSVVFLKNIHQNGEKQPFLAMPPIVAAIYATSGVYCAGAISFVTALAAAIGNHPERFLASLNIIARPSVYVMIPAGMAIYSEVVRGKNSAVGKGERVISACMISVGLIGITKTTISLLEIFPGLPTAFNTDKVFSFLMMLAGLPMIVIALSWIPLWKRRADHTMSTPVLYLLSSLIWLSVGGVTGFILELISNRWELIGSYYLVGHFHIILFGTIIMSLLSGYTFIFPHKHERIAWLAVNLGVLLTFVPQLRLGSLGLVRRTLSQNPALLRWERISTVGSWVMALGIILHIIDWFQER